MENRKGKKGSKEGLIYKFLKLKTKNKGEKKKIKRGEKLPRTR